jgi:hypothetical protein
MTFAASPLALEYCVGKGIVFGEFYQNPLI